jgi:hypothetical protein
MRAKTKAALSCQSQRLSASHFDLTILILTPTFVNMYHIISISNSVYHITGSSRAAQLPCRQPPTVEAMEDGGFTFGSGELIDS